VSTFVEQLRTAVPVNVFAEKVGVSLNTAWRYVLDRRITSFKIGGRRLISGDAIEEFLQARLTVAEPPEPRPRQEGQPRAMAARAARRTEKQRQADAEIAVQRAKALGC
jgi:hypothetical protein